MPAMDDAPDPETPCHFHEQGAVIDVHDLSRIHLGDVEGDAEDIRIRFAEMNEARRNEEIDKCPQFELTDPVFVKFTPLVVDYCDLQPVMGFQPADQLDHLRNWAGLGE